MYGWLKKIKKGLKNEVVALDVIPEKVDMINNRISPIKDEYIEKFSREKKLNLRATLDYKDALKGAEAYLAPVCGRRESGPRYRQEACGVRVLYNDELYGLP